MSKNGGGRERKRTLKVLNLVFRQEKMRQVGKEPLLFYWRQVKHGLISPCGRTARAQGLLDEFIPYGGEHYGQGGQSNGNRRREEQGEAYKTSQTSVVRPPPSKGSSDPGGYLPDFSSAPPSILSPSCPSTEKRVGLAGPKADAARSSDARSALAALAGGRES